MMLARMAGPALRPFVGTMWVSDEAPAGDRLERVLPTGAMHIVFRLTDHPLRIYASEADRVGRDHAIAVVGGARVGPYLRDVSQPMRAVGAMLLPGAAALLLGAPAHELAERHTPLEDLWGTEAARTRDRLLEAGSPTAKLDLLETILRERLPRLRGLHPAVAHAIERLHEGIEVGAVARETGYSHRHFVALFRDSVGLAPKQYCRVKRFGSALGALHDSDLGLADVALAAGYADQSHFNRDFRELAGLTPARYRALGPQNAHHVPVREVNSVQDAGRSELHGEAINRKDPP